MIYICDALCFLVPHSVVPNFRGGGDFFQGGRGCSCHKKKLKSEIFNDKKILKAKIFFSVTTKNSNWEILPKNLVTFKR